MEFGFQCLLTLEPTFALAQHAQPACPFIARVSRYMISFEIENSILYIYAEIEMRILVGGSRAGPIRGID